MTKKKIGKNDILEILPLGIMVILDILIVIAVWSFCKNLRG